MVKDINIDVIVNTQLKELAKSADLNSNNKIDKRKEFKDLAAKLANIQDEKLKATDEYKNLVDWAGGTRKERKAARKAMESRQVAIAEEKYREKIAETETVQKKNGDYEVLDSKREIKKELKKEAETKYEKKAIDNLKPERAIAARHNKYEARYNGFDKKEGIYDEEENKGLASVSEKELKTLKENFGQKINVFKNHNIYKILEKSGYLAKIKNSDGTYNFRDLADAVFEGTGYDYLVNRSKQFDVRELDCIKSNIVALINEEMGYVKRNEKGEFVIVEPDKMLHKDDFNDQQVRNLINFVAIKYEPRSRDVIEALKDSAPGALIAALAGGISAYCASAKVLNTNYVSMTVTNSVAAEIMEKLELSSGTAVTEELGDGRTRIIIDQQQFVDRAFSEAITNGLISMGIGAALSFALGLAYGKDKDFEQACLSLTKYKSNDAETTKTRFAENLDENKANMLSCILDAYVKEHGEYKGMAQFWLDLENIAGNGSILNCDEIRGARMYHDEISKVKVKIPGTEPVDPEPVKPEPVKPEPVKPEPVTPNPIPEVPACQIGAIEDIKLDGMDGRPNSLKLGWHEIIMMYYSDCLANHSEKEIRFQIRKINGVPNNCTYVPKGIVLPYDLFGDGSCFRTDKKDVSVRKYKQSTTRPRAIQTPDGGWRGYISCPNADGTSGITWVPGKYPSKEAAEEAARKLQ